jgi:hypothetical protein
MKDKQYELKIAARKEALAANDTCTSCKMTLHEVRELYAGGIRCSCAFVEQKLQLTKTQKKK